MIKKPDFFTNIIPVFILFWGAIGISNLIGKWNQIRVNPFEFISINDFLTIPILSTVQNYFPYLFVMTLLYIVNPLKLPKNEIILEIKKYNSNKNRKNITTFLLPFIISWYPVFIDLFELGSQRPYILIALYIFLSLLYFMYSEEFLDIITSSFIRNAIIFGIPFIVISYSFGYVDGYAIIDNKHKNKIFSFIDNPNGELDCFIYYGKLGEHYFLVRGQKIIILDKQSQMKLKITSKGKDSFPDRCLNT